MGGIANQRIAGAGTVPLAAIPRLRIEHLWMLMPILLVTWMGFMHPLRRLDFWWHLKVGEIIVTSGQIPQVDLFSFTRAGQPFTYQNWLGEILYYLTYLAGGLPLLIAFSTVLLLLAFIPIYHLCLETNSPLRAAMLCSLIAAFVLGLYSNLRPQTYSFVLFAWFYWILWRYREGRCDLRWALPLLMLLWVNLHGAFVLGIAMLGTILGAEAVRRLVRGPRADTLSWRALAELALILGLTLLATVANPEGHRIYTYVRQIQSSPSVQLFVKEWQVPDIKNWSDLATFFGPFFLVWLVLLYSRHRPNLTELGLLLVFATLGLAASRNAIWFVLVATPILARHVEAFELSGLPRELRSRPILGQFVRWVEGRSHVTTPGRYRLNWTIAVLLLTFTIILSPWVRPHLQTPGLRPRLIEQGTPIGAIDYIAEQALQGHIFHPQEYGDYLIWRLWPQHHSFIDGRVHLYDAPFVRDYILIFDDDHWQSRIARFDIKYLLLPKDDEKAESMIKDARASEHWALLYEDEISVLFEKQ